MASIHLRKEHTLGIAGARKAVSDLAVQLAASLEVQYAWHGDVLTFERSDVHGSICVAETEVTVDAELGGMLGLFKGPVEKQVTTYLDQHLG